MAYTDLDSLHSAVPGDSPPASWGVAINANSDFFYAHRREVCTSGTRPTGVDGLQIFETDTDRELIHDGTDWRRGYSIGADETYTPTWTQSVTITKTTTLSVYRRVGRRYEGNVVLAGTSAGTAANAIKVTTPATAAFASNAAVGRGYYYNGSVNLPLVVILDSTGTFSFLPSFTASAGLFGTAAVFYTSGAGANTSFTPTVANGHSLVFDYSFTATA